MPQASAFTNSVRAYSEGRNNKVQTPKNSLNIDNLRGLSCSSIDWSPIRYAESCKKCSNLPKVKLEQPTLYIAYRTDRYRGLIATWHNLPPQTIDVEFRSYTDIGGRDDTLIDKVININSSPGFATTSDSIQLNTLHYFYAVIIPQVGNNIQSENLINTQYVGTGGGGI